MIVALVMKRKLNVCEVTEHTQNCATLFKATEKRHQFTDIIITQNKTLN